MTISKCKCGNEINTNCYKEAGTVNDKYLIIYECEKCAKKGYTVAINSTDIDAAKVLKVMDFQMHDENSRDNILKQYGLV